MAKARRRKDGTPFGRMTLNTNEHYVYFKSLASCHLPIYKSQLDLGTSYVNRAAAALHPQENDDVEGLKKIADYINMIGKLAENERANEIFFIQNLSSIIHKDPKLEGMFGSFVDSLKKGEVFDYITFMAVLNMIMKHKTSKKEIRQRFQLYKENMKLEKRNYEKLDEEQQKEIQEAFEKGYNEYIQKAQELLLDAIKKEDNVVLSHKKTYSELVSTRVNSIIDQLGNNEIFLSKLRESIGNDKSISEEELADYLTTLIFEDVSRYGYQTLKETKASDIAQRIMNKAFKNPRSFSKDLVENVSNAAKKKAEKTLEKMSLSTGRNLGALFDALEDSEKEGFQEFYQVDLSKELAELERARKDTSDKARQMLASARGKLTKKLNETIRNYAKKEYNIELSDTQKELEKKIEAKNKKKSDFFKSRKLKDSIRNKMRVTIDAPSIEEVIGQKDNMAALEECIQKSFYLGGSTVKMKADVAATVSFDKNIELEDEDAADEISNSMSTFFKDFLNETNKRAKGQTNVSIAEDVYVDTMKGISNMIENLQKNQQIRDEELQRLYEQLSNFINESISVKNYNLYSTDLGFHGGSLGADGKPEKVIENINKMYALGGLEPASYDLLVFAAINACSQSIGAELKDDLATYLLGGAAMMMFDDGFAATQNFMDRMMGQFGFAPKTLHLYLLQDLYVPASYVYETVHSQLLDAYKDLAITVEASAFPTSGSNRVIITNPLVEEEVIPSYLEEGYEQPQARWNKVSSEALSSVKIEFVFMAGMLDIFQQIAYAFKV